MKSGTSTVPGTQTRPRSLRARSTSITCSARSFGSASRPSASRTSSSSRRARAAGCRPAGGRRRSVPVTVTSASGEEPTTSNGALPAGEAQQVHVRRRVGRPQHPVEVERVDVGRQLEALGEHHLEGVAGPDVLADPLDARPRRRPGARLLVTGGASAGSSTATPGGHGLGEVGGHRVQPGDGVVVAAAPPRRALAISSTVPSVWSSTARSVTSIIASSGMPRSSALVSGSRSSRRTTSYPR